MTRLQPPVARSISSVEDCESLGRLIVEHPASENPEKVFAQKLRSNVWNKIITSKEFENFNDQEYFKWLEIYKDPSKDLSQLNPVSIEQKLALIEVINSRYIVDVTGHNHKINSEIEKLGELRLRTLGKTLKRFNLSSKLTREGLEDFASDLMLVLKGPPVSLMDYFITNKTSKAKIRLARTVQEDMLLMGLRGVMNRIPEKDAYTKLEKSRYLVQRFFQLRIWKYLVLPYDLPWIERVKIPDELLEKILIDGLDAHEQELIALLKKQDMIDHYERFRKVYRPIAFSVGFYVYYKKFDGKMSQNEDEERSKLIREFTEIAEKVVVISDAPEKPIDEVKEEHFQRLLKRYEAENGKKPSDAEYFEMRERIYNAP